MELAVLAGTFEVEMQAIFILFYKLLTFAANNSSFSLARHLNGSISQETVLASPLHKRAEMQSE